ncbi:MAG: hypothetical protein JXD23_16030 [Spirochaetales bacterium]|nr:hypothetical protein [Spirochaetales bacterium]
MKTLRLIFYIAVLIALLGFSCDLLFDNPNPHGLSATDGESEITVSWSAPSFPEGEEKAVDFYDLHIIETGGHESPVYASYVDSGVPSGVVRTYEVQAHFTDASISGWSNQDSGYAIRATKLLVGDGVDQYPGTATSESTGYAWLSFLAQGGWPYTVSFPVTTTATIMSKGSASPSPVVSSGTSPLTWTASSTGTYWIRVDVGGSGTDVELSVWHH